MTSNGLDETDRELLSIISRKSNISYSELADELGISRNTAYRRVKKLKEAGAIKEDFITNTSVDVLEFEKMGMTTLTLALGFEIDSLEEATGFLEEREEVKMLFETYGEYDVIAILFGLEGNERKLVSNLRQGLEEEGIGLERLEVFPTSLKKLDLTLPL